MNRRTSCHSIIMPRGRGCHGSAVDWSCLTIIWRRVGEARSVERQERGPHFWALREVKMAASLMLAVEALEQFAQFVREPAAYVKQR